MLWLVDDWFKMVNVFNLLPVYITKYGAKYYEYKSFNVMLIWLFDLQRLKLKFFLTF